MFEWEVFTVENRSDLRTKLNSIAQSGWEIFQVVALSDRKIMMMQVPMPGEVQFEIIVRRRKGA